MDKIIDAHIHLDQYTDKEIRNMIAHLDDIHCTHLIAVSTHLDSCKKTKQLADTYAQVKPAFGLHPEQPLPSDLQMSDLLTWMDDNKDAMVAIGEIGLPYYLRKETATGSFPQEGYIELLDQFLQKAKAWKKPVILHAVYDDAPIVCDLLEKHPVEKAHFHWFKGDPVTIERMIENGYFISVTPDVVYEQEIQNLVKQYPLAQLMVETDGPWQFEGEFAHHMTHPRILHTSISTIAMLKNMSISEVYNSLHTNTCRFFNLQPTY